MSTLPQDSFRYSYDNYKQLYLENTTDGHTKFYEMTAFTSVAGRVSWAARWGKIGTHGQTMTYSRNVWGDILSKKLKKGYVLERADGLVPKPPGTPPPIVHPRNADEENVDVNFMSKIDRVILFLESKSKPGVKVAEAIKLEYIQNGFLNKSDMQIINNLWQRNGGGRWVE